MKRYQIILLVVLSLVAFGIRVSYLHNMKIVNPVRSDAAKYATIADNLVNNNIYSHGRNATKPSYMITPGYPFYLAAILKLTKRWDIAYLVTLDSQAVMGAAIVLLTVLIALHFLPFPLAYAAGVLTTISPHLITVGALMLTETLFTFLLMLAIWVLLRGFAAQSVGWIIAAGLLFGSAALVRPAIIAFPLFILPLLFFSSHWRGWRAPTALLLTAFIIYGSWVGWTSIHAGQATKSTSLLSSSLFLGHYPDLIYKDPRLKGFPYREDPAYEKYSNELPLTLQILGERFQQEPLRYLSWYLFGKAAMFWSKDIVAGAGGIHVYPVVSTLFDVSSIARYPMKMMQSAHFSIVFAVFLGAFLIFYLRRREIVSHEQLTGVAIVYALLVYITFVHMVLAPLPRYSIPFRPVLYIAFMLTIYFAVVVVNRRLNNSQTTK